MVSLISQLVDSEYLRICPVCQQEQIVRGPSKSKGLHRDEWYILCCNKKTWVGKILNCSNIRLTTSTSGRSKVKITQLNDSSDIESHDSQPPLQRIVQWGKYKGQTYHKVMYTRAGREYLRWWSGLPDDGTDFRKRHVQNINECFQIYDRFVEQEYSRKNIKRPADHDP